MGKVGPVEEKERAKYPPPPQVFHPGVSSNHSDDQPYSWSQPPYHPPTQQYKNSPVCPGPNSSLHTNLFCPVELADQPGGSLPDLQTVEQARAFLLHNHSQPFLLCVGLHKPHVPHKQGCRKWVYWTNCLPSDSLGLGNTRNLS